MPTIADLSQLLLPWHRVLGYSTLFVVAPLALLTFARARTHPALGWLYVGAMTVLYLSGSVRTFAEHPWQSWAFARNIAFNFFGFSMLVHGVRAMRLFRHRGDPEPGGLDRLLLGVLAISVAGLLAVAILQNTPMRVLTVLGVVLLVLDLRDHRARFRPKAVLMRRHVRYMLASYAYLLTVASIVHLGDELSHDVKWLWPSAVAAIAIAFAERGRGERDPRGRRGAARRSAFATAAIGLVFGLYVAYELVAGERTTGPSGTTARSLELSDARSVGLEHERASDAGASLATTVASPAHSATNGNGHPHAETSID